MKCKSKNDVIEYKNDVIEYKNDVIEFKNDAIKSKNDVIESKNDVIESKNDVIEYKKQRNLVLKLKKRCNKRFFDKLETKNNSEPFWSTSSPNFSNKHAEGDADILLIKNDKFLLDNRK